MQTIIRGADINFEKYDFENLGQIFDLIQINNYVILKIIADGIDITNYANSEIENIKPIEEVEVIVQDKEKLTKESIEEAKRYLPKLISGVDSIIDKFVNDKEMVGFKMLSDAIQGFQWINIFINNLVSENLLSQNDEKSFKEWQEIFPEFLNALEKQDIVLVNDLLEYEIKPLLKKFDDIVTNININEK